MKNRIALTLLPLLLLLLSGCGDSSPSPAENQKLKEDFAQKEFDINKVPEKDRARVEGIMKANGAQSKK